MFVESMPFKERMIYLYLLDDEAADNCGVHHPSSHPIFNGCLRGVR